MLIHGTDPVATPKPDARLIKLLLMARRFNATLVGSDGVPFAALAERAGVRVDPKVPIGSDDEGIRTLVDSHYGIM
jgi:hypothetical protein